VDITEMIQNKTQNGFSLIEVMMAMVIMLVGILGALEAITSSVLSMQGSEKRTISKEVVRSSMETIFSIRDLLAFDSQVGGTQYSWPALQSASNGGMFLDGWTPIRQTPGVDGVFGTGDDACPAGNACVVNGITNNSPVLAGYQRKVDVQDIIENGVVRKRLFTIRVRYFVGGLQRELSQSTIIANLPLN
jgi:prepilin-type N-terminal cleavage/methylation domain-containing protein